MIRWPYLAAVGIFIGTGIYCISVIWRSEQTLHKMRESIKEFAAISASHEELLNAALEGELPSDEVRERAWKVFIERNSLS